MSKYDLAYKALDELPASDALTTSDYFVTFDATTGAPSKATGTQLATFIEAGGLDPLTITSTNASALAVGRQGATAPVLKVNANTASVATGIEIIGAAAAGGVAVNAISSGTNENLTVDAKGSGTITLAGTSTGNVVIPRAFAQGTDATDRATIKGIYLSPANVVVAVPAIANDAAENADSVAVDVSGAFSMQPAVGDAVIAIPQEAMETDCLIAGAYVTATDTITVTFMSKEGGAGVTGGNKNFKFLVIDLT